jgi:hypothetical protein
MNYFAHGLPWIDEPYVLAGTAIPDWLSVVDRKVRVRSRQAAPFVDSADRPVAQLAQGVVQHHRDDALFHESQAFAELLLQFCRDLRQTLPADDGFRPYFLGHILVELLLDAELIAARQADLSRYYQAFDELDAQRLADAVVTIAGRPIPNLATFIALFLDERFLWDYLDDAKLLKRLNQVMRRVGLPTLPAQLIDFLPEARRAVSRRSGELLAFRPTAQLNLTSN